ncbi:MAG: Asp-tRNA(Asn)/Glu-tRNA(Gln) amidotransferase subunit GatB [Proteobacteria bacterium]|jgi:aspartyl-tRNA(Asn)/glutamyl-tRNA(Gln) amidotransferase subunit B|nr:Asp-tRNA(Asn)/Glu-tRNA(Gln) amidotransferase subunit GatB [Pseudomonadota bacterium]
MYQAIIGLECHAQLDTRTKMFCGCPVVERASPNSAICPICLGHPGTLPTLNARAVQQGLKAALALSCRVQTRSVFERKQYFYPDLPKGYQISQFEHPLAIDGWLHLNERKRVGIRQVHLEEDAGKSFHRGGTTGVDFNRAGTPLVEIVSEPQMGSSAEAVAYLRLLRRVLVEGGICVGDMEWGAFRCDANVSVHCPGEPLGVRVEVKNLNSFRAVGRAIDYEIERQRRVLEQGGAVLSETRSWRNGQTVALRRKEGEADYRYFPDPDLPPLVIGEEDLQVAQEELPAIPLDLWLVQGDVGRKGAFVERYGLDDYVARVMLASPEAASIFEQAVAAKGEVRAMANWVQGEVLRLIKERGPAKESGLTAHRLVDLQQLVDENVIAMGQAKTVLEEMWKDGDTPRSIVDRLGLAIVGDEELIRAAAKQAIKDNPTQVKKYKGGRKSMIGFFMGQVMGATRGRADPKMANRIVVNELDNA